MLLLGDDPTTGVDVALKLVEEGLATVRDNCHDEALKAAEESAKAAGRHILLSCSLALLLSCSCSRLKSRK